MNEEVLNNIINIKKKIDKFSGSHNDDDALVDEITNLCNDNNFRSEEYIIKEFEDNVNLDRTLRVGIVGRVKSGKSSLLNSLLFDGKDILPKAATPMTATLTHIQYSDTNYIEVEFITKEDIEDLKKNYNKYNETLKKEIENLKETIGEKIKSAVGTRLSAGITAINKFKSKVTRGENINSEEDNGNIKEYYDYDKLEKQAKEIVDKNEYLKNKKEKYDLIKNANKSVYKHVLEQEKERINFKNIEEISDKLKDYVGADGKFVDFVKSLNIYINIEYLKDLSILDTPGFNDPVETRDAKARELLSKCDVVLILMPASRLFTESDRDIILKIRKKEGIQEIYVVISMFDDVLNSQENIQKSRGDLEKAELNPETKTVEMIENIQKSGGDLEKAKNIILDGLKKHIKNIFIEMNDENIFNELISEIDKRVIYSSGICHSIIKNWDNLDEAYKVVIKNLSEAYPDYISLEERETSLEQLKQLANIDAIHDILKKVREEKNEILGKNLNKFETKFMESANEIKRKLNRYAREREKDIKYGNIENIEIELKKLEKSTNKISKSLKGKFEDTVEEWYEKSLNEINKLLDKFFKEAKDSAEKAKSEETRTKKEGWWIFGKNVQYQENTINTEKIRELIREYARNFNRQLEIFIINIYKSFREELITNTTDIFKEEELDINREQVSSIIRPIMREYENNINIYDDNPHLDLIEETGTISGPSFDKLVNKVNDIIRKMDKDFDKIVKEDNLKDFKNKISEIDFANKVLSNYRNRINKYKEEIENREKAIDKWNRIKEEIDNLV